MSQISRALDKNAKELRDAVNEMVEHAAIIVEGNPYNEGLKDPKGLANEVRKLKIPESIT